MTADPGGRLTTHVLDTATGRPAIGLRLTLHRLPQRELLGEWRTNADGRCDGPLLAGAALLASEYELVFDVAEWRAGLSFQDSGFHEPGINESGLNLRVNDRGFYDTVPIRFRVTDSNAHHHVPLILSPYGYATYRGS